MNDIERTYMAQVREALWGGDELTSESVNELTTEVLAMHMQQGTGPLVYPALQEKSLNTNSLNTKHLLLLKQLCVQNMQTQAKMQMVLEQAWKALEKAGIQPVLMKGASLAALYPEPSMRQWGDIDLFVGKEQYHPACAVMRETFPKALKFDEELDHYKHYNIIADGVSIETHRVSVNMTHPRDVRLYAKMEAFGVEHASELEIGDLKVKIFEPTFNALFVFLHAWEHLITEGANIRQLCDLALLLQHERETIDWKRLERWLKELKLWEVWQVYMFVLTHYFEVKSERINELMSERAERLMDVILNGRKKELKNERVKEYRNRFVRKWHTMQERVANAEWVAQFSPAYARHMKVAIWLSGLARLFAPDRHWE